MYFIAKYELYRYVGLNFSFSRPMVEDITYVVASLINTNLFGPNAGEKKHN